MTVAAVEAGVPSLADARTLIDRFQARISLTAWLARGVAKDIATIRAAIIEAWSSGQTEGQITRLKLVKRQMSCIAVTSWSYRP